MLAPHSAHRVETRRAEWARGSWSAQLRRSSDSVAAPSQQYYNLALNWSSSSRSSSTCGQQHLEEGRGGTSRGDPSCAQHQLRRSIISSVAAAEAGDGSVPRR